MTERFDHPLTRDELAQLANVDPALVDRLVDVRVISPREGDRPFTYGDVARVGLATACEQAGLPLESIGVAIRAGTLSFAFVGAPPYTWPVRLPRTYAELATELNIEPEHLLRVYEAMGSARPSLQDHIREDDADILTPAAIGLAAGIPFESVVRLARVYGESLRRVTQAETAVFHNDIETPFFRSGLNQRQTFEAAAGFGATINPVMGRGLLALYLRIQERTWIDHMVEHVEVALEEAGIERRVASPPAMCFLDLAGYTRLTEERGDEAAADLAARLAAMVDRSARANNGRAVKWLGDRVMFHFRSPADGVRAAIDMVARTPKEGLPPAHAGLSAGPIVEQDGDYYGRTVNLASRIAAFAEPGRTLVDERVVEATDDADLSYREVGPVELKGMTRPVTLFEASLARTQLRSNT